MTTKPGSVSRRRWRAWRACGLVLTLGAGTGACTSHRLASPTMDLSQTTNPRISISMNRRLDMLFMIDDSSSMGPLQGKLAARLPDFMQVLQGLPGGLPDLHVAVVSSSLGAGIYGNVPGCGPGSPGNDDGLFRHAPECTALHAGETFIRASADGSANNFDGRIEDVFACIARLGDQGCGFEHPLASVQQALTRALIPGDPNWGFLRADAALVHLMGPD